MYLQIDNHDSKLAAAVSTNVQLYFYNTYLVLDRGWDGYRLVDLRVELDPQLIHPPSESISTSYILGEIAVLTQSRV